MIRLYRAPFSTNVERVALALAYKGLEFSATDVAAFPFLKYALLHDLEDDELFHRILVEHQRDGVGRPRLDAWIRRVNARPRA